MQVEWIRNLELVALFGFSFSIISYVLFFKHIQIRMNHLGSSFIAPLLIITVGFVFHKDIPISRIVALSDIALALSVMVICVIGKYKIKLESSIFINILFGIIACLFLTPASKFSLLYHDQQTYLIIGFVLNFMLVIFSRNNEESHTIGYFSFLGISQLAEIYSSVPLPALVSLVFRTIFYYQITRSLFSGIHDEIMKEVESAKKIRKDFNDEIRKEVKKQLFYMEMSQKRMAKISQTDALTEAYNRKGILNIIDRLIDHKDTKVFSVLIFDIDRFKNINDTLGHVVGDACLKTLAHIARANLRDGDSLGRYGGDEFIIVLADANEETAFKVAGRFRSKVEDTDDPHFTISIGIATYPHDGRTQKELIEYADQGLYISKERGRNRVSRKGQ